MQIYQYTKHTGFMSDRHTFLVGVESSPYGVYAAMCQVGIETAIRQNPPSLRI